MFYVYDKAGLQFSGPMEALRSHLKIQKSSDSRSLDFDDQLKHIGPGGKQAQAVASYKKMIDKESMVEPLVHIYQIMSTPVQTASPQMKIIDAWSKLRQLSIRQLVIVTDSMKVTGLITDRQILRHIIVGEEELSVERDLYLEHIIDNDVISTDAMSDIRRVAKVMALYHIDAMPVLQEKRLSGIVTRGDILRGFAENPKLNLWA